MKCYDQELYANKQVNVADFSQPFTSDKPRPQLYIFVVILNIPTTVKGSETMKAA